MIQIIQMYTVIQIGTKNLLMGIICTLVGYNVLHIQLYMQCTWNHICCWTVIFVIPLQSFGTAAGMVQCNSRSSNNSHVDDKIEQ